MPRTARRIRAKTQEILKSLSTERQDFGLHWDEVEPSRYDGTLSDDGLEKMCMFVATAKECGFPAGGFSQREMNKPLKWRFNSISHKTHKLCAKRVRALMANRQGVAESEPTSSDEEAEDPAYRPEEPASEPDDEQTNRSVTPVDDQWHPPMLAVGEDPLEDEQAITHEHWLGPDGIQLREQPLTDQNQVMLQFATGPALFPTNLLAASAEDRYSFHETVVCFDKEASVAQVPASIPAPHREACINRVRSCNPRLKPSSQECYESIVRCSLHRQPFHLTDLIAMFAFVHYDIAKTGRNRWLWQKMGLAGAERFCDPGYQWRIVAGVVVDGQGRSLAHLVTTSPPPGLVRRKTLSQIGSKKDRAKFQRHNIHVFQGYNEDGVGIYQTYYDKYLANQEAINRLRRDRLDISTDLDVEDRNAQAPP